MTTEDRLAYIKEKWRFAFDMPRSALWGESDVKWLIAEVDRLETAWRAAEDQCFADTQTIVHLASLLHRLRCFVALNVPLSAQDDPYFKTLAADIDEAIKQVKHG